MYELIFNTLKPNSSNGYTLSCTLALNPERQSARMSEILKNDMLGLYGTDHSKCNHIMTLDLKALKG